MPREDFVYVNLDRPLAEEVDRAIDSIRRIGGVKKYDDRKSFVQEAIIKLLEAEGKKKREVSA